MAVKIVPVSKEYWMVKSSNQIAANLARESLREFTTIHLKENSLCTKTSKVVLDFIGGSAYKTSLRRFLKMVGAKLEKDIPYLKPGNLVQAFYTIPTSDMRATFNLVNDKSVIRYLARVNRMLLAEDIPLGFSVPYEQTIFTLKVDFKYNGSGTSQTKLYFLMYLIPQILKCLRTLQRKALFTHADARNHFSPASTKQSLF